MSDTRLDRGVRMSVTYCTDSHCVGIEFILGEEACHDLTNYRSACRYLTTFHLSNSPSTPSWCIQASSCLD